MAREIKLTRNGKIIFAVVLTIMLVFGFSAFLRWDRMDEMSPHTHDWMTGSAIKFVNNWLDEGILNLKFMMLENPASIEFETIEERQPYASYLPTVLLPVYITSKIMGTHPTPEHVRVFALINHLLFAVFGALAVFFMQKRLKAGDAAAFAFAALTGFGLCFITGAYYYMLQTYWTDMAVMAPFSFLAMLEMLRGERLRKKQTAAIDILQFITVFIGCMTDWFMYFVTFTIWLCRLVSGRSKGRVFRDMLIFGLPALLSLGLYVRYIFVSYGNFERIMQVFRIRAGLSQDPDFVQEKPYPFRFLYLNMQSCLGAVGTYIMMITVPVFIFYGVTLLLKKDKGKNGSFALYASSILLIPCLLHIIVLNGHSYGHLFSALKFALPLFMTVFGALPYAVAAKHGFDMRDGLRINYDIKPASLVLKGREIRLRGSFSGPVAGIAAMLMVYACVCWAGRNYAHTLFYTSATSNYQYEYAVEKFVARASVYEDFVLSPEALAPANDPVNLSYSRKRIYYATTIEEMVGTVEDAQLSGNAYVCVAATGDFTQKYMDEDMKALLAMGEDACSDKETGAYYIRFSLDGFLEKARAFIHDENEED